MLLAVFHPDDTQKGYSTRVVKDVFPLSSWRFLRKVTRSWSYESDPKEVADYCTRILTPEGKELVASLYKRTELAPVAHDPVVDVLKKKYGDITVSSFTLLKTNGKMSGRMYYFTFDGKKRTAVFDNDSKEISISPGHVKQGTFYLSEWRTLSGKPAVGVNNRVYSHEYRRLHKGHGIGLNHRP